MLKEPLRCTASTSDQSDQLMRWKMRFTQDAGVVDQDVDAAEGGGGAGLHDLVGVFSASAIDSVEAIASPPPRLISSTTSCAGEASVAGAFEASRRLSQTTTAAPSRAIVQRNAAPDCRGRRR